MLFYFSLKFFLSAINNCFSSESLKYNLMNSEKINSYGFPMPFILDCIFNLIMRNLFFFSLVFCTICHSCFDLVFVILIYNHLSMFLIGKQALRA